MRRMDGGDEPLPGERAPTRAAEWVRAIALEELPPGTLKSFKHPPHQLVLVRTADGAVHALDNRCPHEGYPLAQGHLRGTSLTCAWHNWKFDVTGGECLLGGEDARAYPTRVTEGEVEVDLAEPDPAERIPVLLASLAKGVYEHDLGQALRYAVRLLALGYDPWRLLADVARHDARHAEYGTTHALPLAADCGRLLGRFRGAEAVHAIAPAIDVCGEANRRLAERALAPPIPGADEAALRAAVEDEDAERAEGLLRGAFASGVELAEIERWLYAVLSDHFTDFGHQLIYMVKAQELLARAGAEYAEDLYVGLLYGTVLATREDALPYLAGHTARWKGARGAFGEIATRGVVRAFDARATRDAVLGGRPQDAFDAVWGPLRAGVAPGDVAAALVGAAAHRLLRFDVKLDSDPEWAENWLWATHRLTFASAVRNAVQRFESPDALSFLFQAVAFVNSGRPMDAGPETAELARIAPLTGAQPADVLLAIGKRDVPRALAATRAVLAAGQLADLRLALEDLLLEPPFVRPIFVAHAIKTVFAALEEYAALAGSPDREVPLLAAVRFLASPVVERRVPDAVHTSLRWVVDGVVPRKKTQ